MQVWLKIFLQLCTYGFFYGLDLIEPFYLKYLTEGHHYRPEEITFYLISHEIYWIVALLVVVFLITDLLRYKPVIVTSAVTSTVAMLILRFSDGIYALMVGRSYHFLFNVMIMCFILQSLGFLYGLSHATEIAYSTYISAKVDRQHYQQVTSLTMSASLFGRFLGAILAQVLFMFTQVSLHTFLYITLFCKCPKQWVYL